VTRRSVLEYAAAVRERYLRASRTEKVLLDEFCKVPGQHRKSAIRLLHRLALKVAWDATDHVCSKRLAPFLPELFPILEHHGNRKDSARPVETHSPRPPF
jgi:hypothetical protein